MSLGIDVGTQGARAVLLDPTGQAAGRGTATLTDDRRTGARHEQDPTDWWRAVCAAVRAALAGSSARIGAVALDATSGTVLVEDAHGDPYGPALMYDDTRATEQAVRAQRIGDPLWSALGYRMQPAWALPKLLWLLDHDAVPPGARLVHQADHLTRRLVGGPVATDTSTALKTGVDLRTAAWPADLLTELGLPVDLLPAIVRPGTELGRVGPDAAAATGIPAGTPVLAGMTDGCAAQIAAAATRPGRWSSALGTTLIVKGSTDALVRDPAGAVYCHRNPDGGWLPGGASSTGAGALTRAFPAATPADLDRLTSAAAALDPPTAATYPLAGHGERFPFVAGDAHGFGPSGGTDAERFSALCHGIAYVERLGYDVLAALGADVSGPVSVSGGTAANAWWNQLRADVLGRPVLVPESVQAATGMAILAAAPPGELAATAERLVRVRARYEPAADRGAALRPGYERLVDALVERGWLPGRPAGVAS